MGLFQGFPSPILYFSQVQGIPVFNEGQKKIGKVSDFFIEYQHFFPQVIAVQFKHKGHFFYIGWEHLSSFSPVGVRIKNSQNIRVGQTFPRIFDLKKSTKNLLSYHRSENITGQTADYPGIAKVILDHQIVDTAGKKVVRVNDIHFLKVGSALKVTHAAVGYRSMLRRLDLDFLFEKILIPLFPQLKKSGEKMINWKFVHAIPHRGIQKNVKLNVANSELGKIHPADLADILEDLGPHERNQVFKQLDMKTQAKALSEIDQDIGVDILEDQKSPEKTADLLQQMGTDEAADLLGEMDNLVATQIISKMKDTDFQEEVEELLEYVEDTAGGIMSTEPLTVGPQTRCSEVLALIQKDDHEFETVFDIYIIDDQERLLGTTSLRKLLVQRADVEIKDFMETSDLLTLRATASWREVAQHMSKYDLINVPIVDNSNKLIGIVSVDDILPWLLKER